MDPERWQRVEELFHAAIARPAGERTAVVTAQCGGDDDLRSEVLALLAAHVEEDSPLDAKRVEDELRFDRYRVLGPLGSGGMGSVFLAEQLHPIRRQVAIKVIRLGMDTERVLKRFEVERQALALMNHDNIARVLDAGTTARGQPYFVMEHVPGQPITTHCDERRLDLRARIAMLCGVCAGVQHAHQKGILHRDLKASNVLVATAGDRAVPKIIDFGLARAIDHRELQATLSSDREIAIGTPEYMSPEQASPETLDVDTRTDVYALGVLAYELLTGFLPLPSDQLRRLPLTELLRAIRESEPPRPSERVIREHPDAVRLAAANRATTPPALVRSLRGELDWIVGRATDKERERRYATVAELADDLRRHLACEPVRAGPPGAGYRLRKLLRRHRGQVVAGIALLLTLVVGLVATAIGFTEAAHQRNRFEAKVQEFDLLATIEQLRGARVRRDALHPAWPERAADMRSWLDTEARRLRDALPELRRTVRALSERANADTPESEHFLRGALTRSLGDIEGFVADEVPAVERDLWWAERIDALTRSHPRARVSWADAAAAIARADDITASALYRPGAIDLRPQTGLVPIGMNPVTRLWEFYDLRSAWDPDAGAAPEELPIPSHGADGAIDVGDATGIVLVLLPGGTFRLGAADDDELATDDEYPATELTLAPFFVARHELTQAQWRRLSGGATPSAFGPDYDTPNVHGLTSAHPVEQVSWDDCDRLLRAHGMTLPTEAQWEYAARAGTVSRWWPGDDREALRGGANLLDRAGIVASGNALTTPWPEFFDGFPVHAPVDGLRPNAFGLHHVHGNVWEWCLDPWASYDEPLTASADGTRGAGDELAPRVIRGGSFLSAHLAARSSKRDYAQRGFFAEDLGVRAARALR
ncbi:MAG: SUMF1/EgtB/PvdO family nonheme iron enzyme [Planctomycetes bacterium]|nr:SUMF1/EgtB/PvdO family nonheme iron enzyme [Planctomycetota bacterium]